MLSSVGFFLFIPTLLAAEPSATLVIPNKEAWTGQKLPFFVELKVKGSFKGAPSFDLPEIPRSVIVKVGSPVLSSETKGDTEFFIQRHEFALFSQQSGKLQLPPVNARFGYQKGYTGPVFDASVKTGPATLQIKRPPNSDPLGFLVTTESLEIEETWDPTPGPLKTGAVLKRTITQKVTQQSGIALKPAPTPEIEGIRTYTSSPEVRDTTERGAFAGERRETVTYLVQSAGLHELPAIRYDWWNPKTEQLESKTLPAVSFTATAPPPPPEPPSPLRFLLWILGAITVLTAILFRRRVVKSCHQIALKIYPPQARAKRALLKACEAADSQAAITAWESLRNFFPGMIRDSELMSEVHKLYRTAYGSSPTHSKWEGHALAAAFKHSFEPAARHPRRDHLPRLNP